MRVDGRRVDIVLAQCLRNVASVAHWRYRGLWDQEGRWGTPEATSWAGPPNVSSRLLPSPSPPDTKLPDTTRHHQTPRDTAVITQDTERWTLGSREYTITAHHSAAGVSRDHPRTLRIHQYNTLRLPHSSKRSIEMRARLHSCPWVEYCMAGSLASTGGNQRPYQVRHFNISHRH